MYNMPIIPLDHLSEEERKLASQIVASKGKNKGRLRASKPKITYEIVTREGRRYRESTMESGSVAYLWRMVAFIVSPIGQHNCLPMMADMDLPYFTISADEHKELKRKLNALADKITDVMKSGDKHGLRRWANVL